MSYGFVDIGVSTVLLIPSKNANLDGWRFLV